jgi:hypothetical protein
VRSPLEPHDVTEELLWRFKRNRTTARFAVGGQENHIDRVFGSKLGCVERDIVVERGIDVGIEALANKPFSLCITAAEKPLGLRSPGSLSLNKTRDAAGHWSDHAHVQSPWIGENESCPPTDDQHVVVSLQCQKCLDETAEVDSVAYGCPPLSDDGLDRARHRFVEHRELRDRYPLAVGYLLEYAPVSEFETGRFRDRMCDFLASGFCLPR